MENKNLNQKNNLYSGETKLKTNDKLNTYISEVSNKFNTILNLDTYLNIPNLTSSNLDKYKQEYTKKDFYDLFTQTRFLNNNSVTQLLGNNALQTKYFYQNILPNLNKGEVVSIKYGGDEFVFFYKDNKNQLKMLLIDVGNMGPVNNILGTKIYIGNNPSGSNIVDIYINNLVELAHKNLGKQDIDTFFAEVKKVGNMLLDLDEEKYSIFAQKYDIKADYKTYREFVEKTKYFAQRRNTHRLYDDNFYSKLDSKNSDLDKIYLEYLNGLNTEFFSFKSVETYIEEILGNKYLLQILQKTGYNDKKYLKLLENYSTQPTFTKIILAQDILFFRDNYEPNSKLLNTNTNLLDIYGSVVNFEGENYADFQQNIKYSESLQSQVKTQNINTKYLHGYKQEFEQFKQEIYKKSQEDENVEYENLIVYYKELSKLNNKIAHLKKTEDTQIVSYYENKALEIVSNIEKIKFNNSRAKGFKNGEYLREVKFSDFQTTKNYLNDNEITDFKVTAITLEQLNTGTLNKINTDLVDKIPEFLITILSSNNFFKDKLKYITLVKDGGGKIRVIGPENILANPEFEKVLNQFNKQIDEYLKKYLSSKENVVSAIDNMGRIGTKKNYSQNTLGNYEMVSKKTMLYSKIESKGGKLYTTLLTK